MNIHIGYELTAHVCIYMYEGIIIYSIHDVLYGVHQTFFTGYPGDEAGEERKY